MYVSTIKRFLRQETKLSGLGTNSLPAGIQKFLDEVRRRPQDFKPLLLAIIFDPVPGYFRSRALVDALVKLNLSTQDEAQALVSDIRLKQVVGKLRDIGEDLRKRDVGFQRLIDAELTLRSEMMKTAGAIRPQKAVEPFLLKASVVSPWAEDLPLNVLGSNFAQQMLPANLNRRLWNSAVSEAHFTSLGKFLQRYAEVLQNRDPAFKQRVEQTKRSP